MKENKTALFETSPWRGWEKIQAPAKTILVEITQEHVSRGIWRRFQDPVSLALQEHLKENASAQVFWNSDSFSPRYYGDDARIGIYVENHDPESGETTENEYHLPLPRRAEREMWKLRSRNIETFQTLRMRVTLPAEALP